MAYPDAVSTIQTTSHLSPDAVEDIQMASLEPEDIIPASVFYPDPIPSCWSEITSWGSRPSSVPPLSNMKRNFMYAETDDDLTFLPKEPSLEFRTESPSVSINMEPPIAKAVPTGQLVENTADSGDSPHSEQLVIHPGSVAARIRERKCRNQRGFFEASCQAKLVQGASSSRSTRAKAAASRDDSPFLTISDDDEGKLSLNVPYIDKEKERDQECEELKAKCEAAMANFDKNPIVSVLRDKIASLSGEVKEHRANLDRMSWRVKMGRLSGGACNAKLDRAEVVSKVVPYVAMELAFEEVAKMKELFDITKVKGYRSSYKQEHMRAMNELAIAIFPFLAELATPSPALMSLPSQITLAATSVSKTQSPPIASYVPKVPGLGHLPIIVEIRLAASRCGSLSPHALLWERRIV
ncbi:hypothetical protein Tco_0252279 [Tanacetum coccineum]